jgi:hypothetical protein
VAWVFFRASSFGHAALIFERLFSLTSYVPNLHWQVVGILILGLGSHYVPEKWYQGALSGFIRLPFVGQAALLFGAALLLRKMASADAVPFVYFQF